MQAVQEDNRARKARGQAPFQTLAEARKRIGTARDQLRVNPFRSVLSKRVMCIDNLPLYAWEQMLQCTCAPGAGSG